jgi:glucokinase
VNDQAIGIDVGGTKIAAFRVAEDGRVLARKTVPTPAEDERATVDAIVVAAREVLTPDVVAVGMGAAGMVEAATGILRYAPNLAWRELPLAARIGQELGLPCQVDNDANVAAWGEYRFGAGRGHQDLLLVAAGTGLGGGVVSGGKLFRGANGFAAEVGHIIVEPDGPLCGCGNRGCWEQVAAGRAIDRLARQALADHPSSLIASLVNGDPDRVTGVVVTEAAQRGDDLAESILAEVGRRLGEGIGGLVNVLDPEVVVVGGGVVGAGDLLLDPAREAFREAVMAPDHRPDVRIVPAELGNEAGAVGAAALALAELRT